ncbi:MAG: hypothetical protein H9882_04340 [Candidatus Fournierella pullistercoris]|uniref:Metal-dependent peptidase n=1 Tax=Candidatus Allofournierella pullistercoris TaxID=2838597 RepID=A0A948T2N5_9FIRM|nr:hypothetical protein [Candidatus Fournierella pullistercoris]
MSNTSSWEEIGEKILSSARSELYMNLPFLDVALGSLVPDCGQHTPRIATDSHKLYYNGSWVALQYEQARSLVCRAFLHSLLHCMLRHPPKAKGRDATLWDVSCDIAVESILDSLPYACLTPRTSRARRNHWYTRLRSDMPVLTAESIYRFLRRNPLDELELASLAREFLEDDHQYWVLAGEDQQQESAPQWQQIGQQVQTQMETVMSEGFADGQAVLEQLRVEHQDVTNYRWFLHRFAVLGEEMAVDADAFDYGYYSYGLRRYGNMPLIEPVENKESRKIQDLVIAIDTSMSTSGELVRQFLGYTYTILKDTESFFRKINLRILQCDNQIRSDVLIQDAKQLAEYMEDFTLIGQSSTDFRPVFTHVEQLIQQGSFHRLRGLVYFTDGLGVYPAHRPSFEAAFVMLAGQSHPERVPVWATRLLIDQDELLQGE